MTGYHCVLLLSQELIAADTPVEVSSPECRPVDAELALRALRVRQQCLHDVILAGNSAFGWPNLTWATLLISEVILVLFVGIEHVRSPMRTAGGGGGDLSNAAGVVWGVALSARFAGMCALGQRVRAQVRTVETAASATGPGPAISVAPRNAARRARFCRSTAASWPCSTPP